MSQFSRSIPAVSVPLHSICVALYDLTWRSAIATNLQAYVTEDQIQHLISEMKRIGESIAQEFCRSMLIGWCGCRSRVDWKESQDSTRG